MTYLEMISAIKKGELKSVYLIAGEETYLTRKIEQAIRKKLLPDSNQDGLNILNGDVGIDELINLVDTVPFFGDRNVIIVRNTTLFKERKKAADEEKAAASNKQEEKLIALLADMPPYSVLILESGEKADKRRKLYKSIVKYGAVAEVSPIRAWEVREWLNEKLLEMNRQFERTTYEYFLEATSMMNPISLSFLDQELDKLALYTKKKIITKADLLQVLASIPEVSIFSMLDAISDKNVKKALLLLSEQLTAGEHPLKMITMLSRHTRQLWQAKLFADKGDSPKKIAESLGLVPFIAEKLTQKSRKFDEKVLKNALINLADADYRLKSGQADCALLERIVIELCA